MEQSALSKPKALEVFLRGFSTTRSFTRPYMASRIGASTWLLADADARAGQERVSEVVTSDTSPAEVMELVGRSAIGRHFLCVLLDDAASATQTRDAYKQSGYRLMGREPLFVLNTADRIRFDAISIRRVTEVREADAVAKAARSRQILTPHLTREDAPCRLYAAFEGDTPIGWVRSIRTHPDCSWVSNLFVAPPCRRRGIGRTLMSAMLDDDARFGVQWSVLLASLTGAKLYPHLGYRERGLLLIFSPPKTP
jgi:GNAT superfamily N-acetyltransferase